MIKFQHHSDKAYIGVDEVGRGAIAGPLVVCALYHPDPMELILMGARDSKETTRDERREFVSKLTRDGKYVFSIQVADSDWINKAGVNTSEAQKFVSCIYDLVNRLDVPLSRVSILGDGDKYYGHFPPEVEMSFKPKADAVEPLIMAASMVAKFVHDDLVDDIAKQYPGWGFESHRGYASPMHIEMLYHNGLLPVHRSRAASKSVFKFVAKRLLEPPVWLKKETDYS